MTKYDEFMADEGNRKLFYEEAYKIHEQELDALREELKAAQPCIKILQRMVMSHKPRMAFRDGPDVSKVCDCNACKALNAYLARYPQPAESEGSEG